MSRIWIALKASVAAPAEVRRIADLVGDKIYNIADVTCRRGTEGSASSDATQQPIVDHEHLHGCETA